MKGDGKGGGLALYWTEDVTVNLLSYSKHHINVHVSESMITCGGARSFMVNRRRAIDTLYGLNSDNSKLVLIDRG